MKAIPLTGNDIRDLPSCSGCTNRGAVLLDSQPFCVHCAGGLAVNYLIQKTEAEKLPSPSITSNYNDRPRSFTQIVPAQQWPQRAAE